MSSSSDNSNLYITSAIKIRKRRSKIIKCVALAYNYQSFILPRSPETPFESSNIECCPYSMQSNIIDSVELNLFLNAKYDYNAWFFLIKEPFQVTHRLTPNKQVRDHNVKQLMELIVLGFIHKFEKKTNYTIPYVIAVIIRADIIVGAADFYCRGFNKPRPDRSLRCPFYQPETYDNMSYIPDAW